MDEEINDQGSTVIVRRSNRPVIFTMPAPDKRSCTSTKDHQHLPDEQWQEDEPVANFDESIRSQRE